MRPLIASESPAPSDDRRRVLVDDDPAGLAELRELRVLELEAHLLGDHLAAGEDRDVLEHPLAAVTEARRLDGDGGEHATELVDDERRERLALDVLGDDEQRLAGLNDLLEHRQEVLDRADLLVGEQDVRIVEHGLHPLVVGDHVLREAALVEAHPVGELELDADGLAVLHAHDAVVADLLDRVRDHATDLLVRGGDRRHAGELLLAGHLRRLLLLRSPTACSTARLDPPVDGHRVGAGGDVPDPVTDDRLREDRGGRGAVAGDLVRSRGDMAHEQRALVRERAPERDLAARPSRRRS